MLKCLISTFVLGAILIMPVRAAPMANAAQNNTPEDYIGAEIDNMDIGETNSNILSEQNAVNPVSNDKPGYGYGYRPGYGEGWGYGYDYLD